MRRNKVNVTQADFQKWAEEALHEWLPGYTSEYSVGAQYRITHVGPGRYLVQPASPTESDQGEPKTFTISLSVREVP